MHTIAGVAVILLLVNCLLEKRFLRRIASIYEGLKKHHCDRCPLREKKENDHG